MNKLLLALLLLFTVAPASAPARALVSNLRALVPGEDAESVGRRQYLHGQLSELFAILRAEEKLDRRNTKKRIKRIQKFLEREVLRTYDPDASLDDIFRNGRYNDAAATALTALLLEEFNVAYKLYVDHWTTHLVADPHRKDVWISWYPDAKDIEQADRDRYQNLYITLLQGTILPGLADPEEKAATEHIYRSYHYNPTEPLKLENYGAYLLYRRAQAVYDAGDVAQTIRLLDHALAQEERPAFLALREVAELQQTAQAGDLVRGSLDELFTQFVADPDNDYVASAILQHFDEQQRLVLASNKPEMTRALLASYLDRTPPARSDWAIELMQLQNLRLLDHYLISNNLTAARVQAEELLIGFPDSLTYQRVFSDIVLLQLRRKFHRGADLYTRLAHLAEQYPFIRNSDAFIDLNLREQALEIRDRFARDDLTGGMAALGHFEHSLLGIPIGPDRNLWTLTAYHAASEYYFREGEYRQALAYLDKALAFAPADPFLTHRRYVLTKYL